ncbi:MAG: PepSY domain-containing protein [Chelatococcus sp.]|uniref:PepSY domain-containing protein n=1 Tax=Chelatococcus sp. TaxID=1953771 RepID=UPI0025C02954|nr:hypothetical protein [Chelatococcus sp.]MBX3537398.1 PepSY domain-containing protein [Chelatococcus sp.]
MAKLSSAAKSPLVRDRSLPRGGLFLVRAMVGSLGLLSVAAVGVPSSSQAAVQCLSAKETRDAVAQKLVVSPAVALRAARASTGGGQAVQARLCRNDSNALIYQFAILRADGKVVRLTLDAVSGKVMRRREHVGQRKNAKPVNEQPPDSTTPAAPAPGKSGL